MKFDIKHRLTDKTLFTAELQKDYGHESRRLGAAVKLAVEAGADLKGADLEGADLKGADLKGADLAYAYLEDANLTPIM